MESDKKQQAKNLFFQTELTKSQIANLLQISRRSITYWVKDGNWEHLKESAKHLPSMLAENCYHIIGNLTEYYLSERRITNPVSHKEADTLHKLAVTIGKLKNRSTINESMEMFGFFLDSLRQKNPNLAMQLMPYVDDYISSRASIQATGVLPPHFTGVNGRIPWVQEDTTEQQLDRREAFYSDPDTIEAYKAAGIELPTDDEITTLPGDDTALPTLLTSFNEQQQTADQEQTAEEHPAQQQYRPEEIGETVRDVQNHYPSGTLMSDPIDQGSAFFPSSDQGTASVRNFCAKSAQEMRKKQRQQLE